MSLYLSGIADTIFAGATAGALAGSAVATTASIATTIVANAILVESNFRHAILHSLRKKLVRAVASTGAAVGGASAAMSVAASVGPLPPVQQGVLSPRLQPFQIPHPRMSQSPPQTPCPRLHPLLGAMGVPPDSGGLIFWAGAMEP